MELLDKWEGGAAIDIESGYELSGLDLSFLRTSNEDLGEKGGCLTALLGQVVTTFENYPTMKSCSDF
ncbi:hypothetical protein [Undibacterium flavidum]|uniref:Uncharacterized protein n=1 Tax=Undibacterium flavidum TaxID=2762297 RepID=A0ABR6Y9S2_9BURK|nr:hypothetical protein [Undibacterium flavidum]MBC3873379.1 hypothetical protein [Undibacterium flavidum]